MIICILFQIVNWLIDSPDLLKLVNCHIPNHVTRQNIFNLEFHRTNSGLNSLISRLRRAANAFCNALDFFEIFYSLQKNVGKLNQNCGILHQFCDIKLYLIYFYCYQYHCCRYKSHVG